MVQQGSGTCKIKMTVHKTVLYIQNKINSLTYRGGVIQRCKHDGGNIKKKQKQVVLSSQPGKLVNATF